MATSVMSAGAPQTSSFETLAIAALRRRRESIALGAVAVFVIAVVVTNFAVRGLRFELPTFAWVAVFGVLLCHFIFSAWNARCPSCEKNIGTLIRSARFCPECGVALKSSRDAV